MSVLACGRRDCEHIMCSRLICNNKYYICDSCWEELLYAKKTWPSKMSKSEVLQHIEDFMDSRPGIMECDVDEEFDRLTKNTQED